MIEKYLDPLQKNENIDNKPDSSPNFVRFK